MTKIRVLSGIALVLSVFLGWYGSERFIAGGSWLWFLAGILGNIFTISATLLFFLTLFAIEMEQGEVVIRKDNWYGRVFLFIADLFVVDTVSLCKIFWLSNFLITAVGAAFGFCIVVVVEQGRWKSIVFVCFLTAIIACFFAIVVAINFLRSTFAKFAKRTEIGRKTSEILSIKIPSNVAVLALGFLLFAIISEFVVMLGLAKILSLIATFVIAVALFMIVIGIATGTVFVFKKFRTTQFGLAVSMLFARACPRISIR